MSKTGKKIIGFLIIVILLAGAFISGAYTSERLRANTNVEASESVDDLSRFLLLESAWNLVDSNYLGELPEISQVTYGAIRGALATINDPYTVFVEPPAREEERERLSGNFGGIGAYLTRNEANELLLEPIRDNPAEAAGVRSGDVLVSVDGVLVTPQMSVAEVTELIKGEKGTIVGLSVRRAGVADEILIEIERGDILVPSVSFRILDEDPAIGLIQLSRFSGESGGEVEAAIKELRTLGATMLVLDLRHNPGGLLSASIDVANHFLRDVPVLYQQSQGQEEEVYHASHDAIAENMSLVVLVDEGTASSAEILAGALQDHSRATLIGTPTFGKGSVQLVYDLADGSSIHVTASRWFTPNRSQIDREGLQPNILVEFSQESIDAGRDEILLRAIEFLESENSS